MGLIELIAVAVEPVFQFMSLLWYAIPIHIRIIFLLFFAFVIGVVMIRNFLL